VDVDEPGRDDLAADVDDARRRASMRAATWPMVSPRIPTSPVVAG